MGDFDAASGCVDLYGAEVTVVVHDFDAWDRAGSQEAKDGVPVVGRAVAKAKGDALFFVLCGALSAEGAGWAMEEVEEGFVEPAETAEASSHRYFGHGHLGFVDELLCEEDATGLGDGDRGRSEVLKEEATELTFAEAEAIGKFFDGVAFTIEGAFGDESEGARDGVRGSAP
jgi:hypothetical protein